MSITINSTVDVAYTDRRGKRITFTGTVAYLPDEAGEMLVRVRGRVRPCNIRDVVVVHPC